MHTPAEAGEIVSAFVATPFSGVERHARRIRLLDDFERTGEPPALPS
jgi:ribose 5-phosphate isomerase B